MIGEMKGIKYESIPKLAAAIQSMEDFNKSTIATIRNRPDYDKSLWTIEGRVMKVNLYEKSIYTLSGGYLWSIKRIVFVQLGTRLSLIKFILLK